jgi:hypothetical protein
LPIDLARLSSSSLKRLRKLVEKEVNRVKDEISKRMPDVSSQRSFVAVSARLLTVEVENDLLGFASSEYVR